MRESPEAVYLYIPLMDKLQMSWSEIKNTPKHELEGLLGAYHTYNILHAFDGYTPEDISGIAKDKPHIRSEYSKSLEMKAIMESKLGKKRIVGSFKDLV
tara:strand:+ start:4164 stop:4460 length:297 start_codon:yes stop_codon:yes gene_type:complete